MTFSPTEEQLTIVAAAKDSTRNLLIRARAGAAKTSTLVLIAEAVYVPIIAVSFNVAIAKEMKERLPGHCESKTLNSIGHGAWGRFIGRSRLVVNKDKTYDFVSAAIQTLSGEDKRKAFEEMAQTMQLIGWAKSVGYVPDDNAWLRSGTCTKFHDDESFFASLDEEPSDWQYETVRAALNNSMKLAFSGEIDFNDQIYLPAIFPAPFYSYPLILLDESQDLSELNHAMVRKLTKQRIIAVGDDCQAIYGFRGAYENSMDLLRETFSMEEHKLTISFRCPQLIVKQAHWRAPDMRWPEWAKEGVVKRFASWGLSDIPDSAVIVCRNNAPIFNMALRLLRNGRYCEIVGADIGKALVKVLTKLGDGSLSRDDALVRLASWRDEKLEKSRNKSTILDQYQCLKIFIDAGNILDDAIAYAETIFRQSGPIKLMTIHKSKGLEFDDVFILDQGLMNITERGGQDRNLMYVAQTRAKSTLSYIDSERFIENV